MASRSSPQVLWLIAAQQQLMAALARDMAQSTNSQPIEKTQKFVNKILGQTFSNATTIVVRERLQGFRLKPDLHILWVEVFPGTSDDDEQRTDPESWIVKITENRSLLEDEWNGYLRCRPPGMYGDSILTTLKRTTDKQGQILSLRYAEGHSVLASGDAVDLEEAFIDCCCFGTPTVRSLEHGIQRIFSRLYRRYYYRSFETRPEDTLKVPSLKERISKGLAKWKDEFVVEPDEDAEATRLSAAERLQHRREALRALAGGRDTFFDPCDYMDFLLANPQHAPRILCGCSHGDLHGRNILASPMENDIGSLCLFDYEDMRPDNAIGWDFVKLETELKIRVYPRLFSGPLDDEYVRNVHDFETQLVWSTENKIHDNRKEKKKFPGGRSGRRLARLILTIRKQAQRYLGRMKHRERDWLEELYFLLLCYGCTMSKIPTYGRKELIPGYIAAGVAARRLDLPYRTLDVRIDEAKTDADEEQRRFPEESGETTERLSKTVDEIYPEKPEESWMSYHVPFAFVQVWSRAGQGRKTLLEAAVFYLKKLRDDYPHVLEIEEELVLTLLELQNFAEANKILNQIDKRYPRGASDEILSRRGRMAKDEGVALWKGITDLPPVAKEAFKRAIQAYQQAYERSKSYYPAVNVASLKYLVVNGDRSEAEKEIEQAESALQRWSNPTDDELVWYEASWGELFFLQARHEDAEQHYRRAVDRHNCQPQYKESMLRQLILLRRVADEDTKNYWNDDKLKSLFGNETFNAISS